MPEWEEAPAAANDHGIDEETTPFRERCHSRMPSLVNLVKATKGVTMKVLVAGASGAIGKQLVPRLVAAGHSVTGLTRSTAGAEAVRALGGEPAIADALDPEAVARAVAEVEPEAIVHELTSLSASLDMRHFDRDFALTNRLRTEGTDHLLSAAQAVGVSRFIAQSYAGWNYARTGGPVKSENDPLDAEPVAAFRGTLEAIRHLEEAVTGAEWTTGIVLRYGGFYGPGAHDDQVRLVRKRLVPLVGGGTGYVSRVHVDDAANATVLAMEQKAQGVFNIVDDEPAPVSVWLPYLAECVGAKPPWRVPVWLARLLAGEMVAGVMTEGRGFSNAKAKRQLGWELRYPSWRQGFKEELA
jgi:nucleoside-diphosphate-sugar epimerase